jgi:hypothetical protein
MYEQPIGPEGIPKGMRWSKKLGRWYDPAAGLKKWREQGNKPRPRGSNTKPVHPNDNVTYDQLLHILSQPGYEIKKGLNKGKGNNY